jgi:hypothetical protein
LLSWVVPFYRYLVHPLADKRQHGRAVGDVGENFAS